MTELVMIRRGGLAQPADELSEERFRALKNGELFRCQVDAPRNIKQLRAVHIMLKKVADNLPEPIGSEELKRHLKRRSRMFTEFVARDGSVMYELDSISPAVMDQARFTEVWRMWKGIIISELLPGITDRELAHEIEIELTRWRGDDGWADR